MGDVEFLKEMALQFFEMSKAAAERGFYELALFHAEHALQLYTKYLIYRKLGDFPQDALPPGSPRQSARAPTAPSAT
jgi:HEPN domain-containing protein